MQNVPVIMPVLPVIMPVLQDLPVIVPTNVSVEESKELSELYGDDYDDLDSIFNR